MCTLVPFNYIKDTFASSAGKIARQILTQFLPSELMSFVCIVSKCSKGFYFLNTKKYSAARGLIITIDLN